jgi:hypothetical protein
MDAAGDAVNWSAVAQRAFLGAALSQAAKGNHDMTTVVERLRASKERIEVRDREFGHRQGRRWAEEEAEYDELWSVAKIAAWTIDVKYDEQLLQNVIDPDTSFQADPRAWETFSDKYFGRGGPSVHMIEGFIKGAKEVFDEVESQI